MYDKQLEELNELIDGLVYRLKTDIMSVEDYSALTDELIDYTQERVELKQEAEIDANISKCFNIVDMSDDAFADMLDKLT